MNDLSIRPLERADRAAVLQLVRDTGMFTDGEVDIAQELIDVWLERADQKDYIIHVAADASGVLGYVCFGPTPGTEYTFDLYWIAVAPAQQRRGIGRRLLNFAESACRARGGRLIVIETSSQEKYEPTRNFYFRSGYHMEAKIKDFYARNDDRLIFTRRFPDAIG